MQKLFLDKSISADLILAFAIGTGFMTSVQIAGPLTISHFFFILFVLMITPQFILETINIRLNLTSLYIFILFFYTWVVLPITTVSSMQAIETLYGVKFVYLFSWGLLPVLLTCFLYYNIKFDLDLDRVLWISCTIFIMLNIVSIIFDINMYGRSRFSGFASNPNQLQIYGTALLCLTLNHSYRLKLTLLLVNLILAQKSGSESYLLYFFIFVSLFVFLKIINMTKLTFSLRFSLALLLAIASSVYVFISFKDAILLIWRNADQGSERLALYYHAIEVIEKAPIWGHGSGFFTGRYNAFGSKEAHNNFLDLAMQFGIFFPLLIFTVFIWTAIKFFKEYKEYASATIIAFSITGMFHMTARHWVFWFVVTTCVMFLDSNTRRKRH